MNYRLLLTLLFVAGCDGQTVYKGQCERDKDCRGNEVCDTAIGECTNRCVQSSECAETQTCAEDRCQTFAKECNEAGECALGTYCDNGGCRKYLERGTSCVDDTQCNTGLCVDEVCCDSTCEGICASCKSSHTGLAAGVCGAVVRGQDPHNECPGSLTCNGANACYAAENGANCADNFECVNNRCNQGVCVECGDGSVTFDEDCDDGNNVDDHNGCDSGCKANSVCGNGQLENVFEECDRGTNNGTGGCSTDCLIQPGYVCEGSPSLCSKIVYVVAEATGAKDGTSWPNAFDNLYDALANLSEPSELWVAAGNYAPQPTNGPWSAMNSFALANNVGIYGGFLGVETARAQRDVNTHQTTLWGEVEHVVRSAAGAEASAVLDGFVVEGGDARGATLNAGGGLYLLGQPTIRNCTVRNNAANAGGGLYVNGAATLENILVENNTATQNGGGLYLAAPPATLTGTIANNTAQNGGGVALGAFTGDFIAGLDILDNSASQNGGGVYFAGGSFTLDGWVISGNNATLKGGGLAIVSTALSLTGVTVEGNSSNLGGGVHVATATEVVLFDQTRIALNTALSGGGLYVDSGTQLTFVDSIVETNQATMGHGGGAYVNGGTPAFSHVSFVTNSATHATAGVAHGGGVYLAGGNATFDGCTFGTNSAASYGGGVFVLNVNPVFRNAVFIWNHADRGGAIYSQGGHMALINATFTRNRSDPGRGVIHAVNGSTSATAELTNSILWDNSDGSNPIGIVNESTSTTTAQYSCIQGGYADEGNINGDPLFVAPSLGNLQLAPASPAVNTGNNQLVPTDMTLDIARRPRIVGTAVDMGAYESQ